ncbi:hypothetical protein H072_8108 [Dactylellina haptotyla CBS 200.50]|uniref:Rhodopsin domain-containing protein n=1 Tax=Dactylellina haptotyla (strain CBS 200.50) TaxID=1284197 RepID=S8BST2_DACHA|nr:hypothetical protein H072_8108 [Dactylellina haptotyla CBS 200.50]
MAAPFCNEERWTPWNGTAWSWVGTGKTENMLFACTPYDPDEYAPIWYNRVGLAVICVSNSLAITAIALRTYFRWQKIKTFGKDDWWLIAAGIILVCLYFPALLVSNRMGSGLYVENIPFENRQALWLSMSGWAFYFIIASMIKVATCMYYLRIIPDHRQRLQHFVYVLSSAIMVLGIVEAGIWVFNCSPVQGNFIYNIEGTECPPVDKARWSWIIFSILVDSALLWIPWRILQQSGLPTAERRVLKLVFGANLLGTLTCVANVYGILAFDGTLSTHTGDDFTHSEAAFILINNGEVLMYVIGACFPVLSPYLVSLARSHVGSKRKSTTLPSWRVSPIEAHQYPRRESNAKRVGNEQTGLNTVLESDERAIMAPEGSDAGDCRRIGTATTMAASVTPEPIHDGLSFLQKNGDGRLSLNFEMPMEAHIRDNGRSKPPPRSADADLERGS